MEQHAGRALSLDDFREQARFVDAAARAAVQGGNGRIPQAFAKQVRLRTAAWLLTVSDRTVADIASSCGFADASHLGREFRKQFGVPPATYRERGGEVAEAGAAIAADAVEDIAD